MKHLTLLIIVLTMRICAYAQEEILLLSTYTKDDSEMPMDTVKYSYGAKNEIREEIRVAYYASQQKWKTYWKISYDYDQDGKLLSVLTVLPNVTGEGWTNYSRFDYEYDQNGRTQFETKYIWFDQWEMTQRTQTFYNSTSGLKDSSLTSKYEEPGIPLNYMRHYFTYNQDGKVTEDLTEFWDNTSDSYEPLARDKYNYNTTGDLLREDHDSWIGHWYASHFFYYYYTSFGEISKRVRYNASTSQINDTKYYVYNKEDQPGSAGKAGDLNKILTYPNPCDDMLHVDFEEGVYTLEMHDNTGRVVLSEMDLSGANTLDVSDLNAGIYHIRAVSQNGGIFTGRICIER